MSLCQLPIHRNSFYHGLPVTTVSWGTGRQCSWSFQSSSSVSPEVLLVLLQPAKEPLLLSHISSLGIFSLGADVRVGSKLFLMLCSAYPSNPFPSPSATHWPTEALSTKECITITLATIQSEQQQSKNGTPPNQDKTRHWNQETT